MIARLLLLEDHVIDGIVYSSSSMSLGTPGDMCCQMLFSWAMQTVNQSEVTYDNLVTVLRVIACCHGNRLVADALYCIQNVIVDQSCMGTGFSNVFM
jgi:predicted metal-binding protein